MQFKHKLIYFALGCALLLITSVVWSKVDVNEDGLVDILDLIIVAQHLGEKPLTEIKADVNGDGEVDISDFVLVGKHFGEMYTEMALIPAGEFNMGDNFNEGWNDELPVHPVYLDAFHIDKYEVTNAQYARFLNEYGQNEDAAGHQLLDLDNGNCLKVGNFYKPKSGYFSS